MVREVNVVQGRLESQEKIPVDNSLTNPIGPLSAKLSTSTIREANEMVRSLQSSSARNKRGPTCREGVQRYSHSVTISS